MKSILGRGLSISHNKEETGVGMRAPVSTRKQVTGRSRDKVRNTWHIKVHLSFEL